MTRERARNFLVMLSGAAAAACVAELIWLDSAEPGTTRGAVAVLFLPWLCAAAANLGVWYFSLPRDEPTALGAFGRTLFWVMTALFGAGFAGIYGWVLLGG